LICAGDIGGTNTRLALFTLDGRGPLRVETYPSAEYEGLAPMLEAFLAANPADVRHACFGVAGPVRDGRSETMNLAWPVDAASLADQLGLDGIALINDVEANAYGVAALTDEDFAVLNEGDPDAVGNAAVISAGTGLGEAGLYWDGERHRPFATEGGHGDFAPRGRLQSEFHDWLAGEHGHVSYERVCSGMGLANIYRFLGGPEAEPHEISAGALDGADELASRALDLMVSIYGAEAGNMALRLMAVGGVYLGGGIPPKIVSKLFDGSFMQAFTDKGRCASLLEAIPVRVILNDRAALLGAARCGVLTFAQRDIAAANQPTLARFP
jgi:glucokinase